MVKLIQRLGMVLAMVAALVGSNVLAGQARADDSGELGSCTIVAGGVGYAYGGGEYTGSGDWYAYSYPNWVVSGSSACEDIQITNLYSMSPWMKFRVRFYPSAGGNYANSWKYVNNSCWSCNMLIATNVANGTWFRVEGVEDVGGTQTVVSENFEARY